MPKLTVTQFNDWLDAYGDKFGDNYLALQSIERSKTVSGGVGGA